MSFIDEVVYLSNYSRTKEAWLKRNGSKYDSIIDMLNSKILEAAKNGQYNLQYILKFTDVSQEDIKELKSWYEFEGFLVGYYSVYNNEKGYVLNIDWGHRVINDAAKRSNEVILF